MAIQPHALLFGTDLASDLSSLGELIDPCHLENVLWRNAIELYRI